MTESPLIRRDGAADPRARARPRRAVKIEFIGLPGAGKSSLATAVGEALGIPVVLQRNSRRDLLVDHPVAFAGAVATSAVRFSGWANRSLAFQLYSRGLQERLTRTTTVFEEGVLLEVWRHLVHGTLDHEPWRRLLRNPFSDLLVVVEAPDELIRSRLPARAGNVDLAMALADSPIEDGSWARARTLLEEVATQAALSQPVIHVRNADSIVAAAEHVTASIRGAFPQLVE